MQRGPVLGGVEGGAGPAAVRPLGREEGGDLGVGAKALLDGPTGRAIAVVQPEPGGVTHGGPAVRQQPVLRFLRGLRLGRGLSPSPRFLEVGYGGDGGKSLSRATGQPDTKAARVPRRNKATVDRTGGAKG